MYGLFSLKFAKLIRIIGEKEERGNAFCSTQFEMMFL